MDPWSLSLYGMKAPMTWEEYKGRLVKFFDFVGLQGTIEERSKVFTDRSKKELNWLFSNLIKFARAQKERVEKESNSDTAADMYCSGR